MRRLEQNSQKFGFPAVLSATEDRQTYSVSERLEQGLCLWRVASARPLPLACCVFQVERSMRRLEQNSQKFGFPAVLSATEDRQTYSVSERLEQGLCLWRVASARPLPLACCVFQVERSMRRLEQNSQKFGFPAVLSATEDRQTYSVSAQWCAVVGSAVGSTSPGECERPMISIELVPHLGGRVCE